MKTGGTLVQLGLVREPHEVKQLPLVFARKSIAGCTIGGIKATEDCLKFCLENNIAPDIKLVEAKDIDDCYATLKRSNADAVRFVIDIKKSMGNKGFMPVPETPIVYTNATFKPIDKLAKL